MEEVVRAALAGLEGLSEEQSGQWLRMAWFIALLVYHRRTNAEYNILISDITSTTRASKFAQSTEVRQMAQTMAEYQEELADKKAEIKAKSMAQSMAQSMVEQAKEEAREEARAEALVTGQTVALRRVLASILTTRFGQLPISTVQAIETAEPSQVERWVVLASTSATLEAVGVGSPH